MILKDLIERARLFPGRIAIICGNQSCTYAQLLADVRRWGDHLGLCGVKPGDCIAMTGVPSPKMVAFLLALMDNANIVMPLLSTSEYQLEDLLQIGCADGLFTFGADDSAAYRKCDSGAQHPLLCQLRGEKPEPGLILFTSGSTGRNKATVHRVAGLIGNVMRQPQRSLRVLIFLMFDHIGGMNTLLYTLWHIGTAVFPSDRSVDAICAAIEKHHVELLPTTPTFLNMMLMAGKCQRYDLSSLRIITYGSEPMATSTLRGLNLAMPNLRYKQMYGLTEGGILPTKSEESGSTWMRVGGGNYEVRIVDDILWIRSDAVMLGYLNAPSPFDDDGWLNTGDRVEIRGSYMRVVGRDSEIINVAGEKVYPSEVEDVILQAGNIADALVSRKSSPVTGHVVMATVRTISPEDPVALEKRIRLYCRDTLAPYKVPAIVRSTVDVLHGGRFKKPRTSAPEIVFQSGAPNVP